MRVFNQIVPRERIYLNVEQLLKLKGHLRASFTSTNVFRRLNERFLSEEEFGRGEDRRTAEHSPISLIYSTMQGRDIEGTSLRINQSRTYGGPGKTSVREDPFSIPYAVSVFLWNGQEGRD